MELPKSIGEEAGNVLQYDGNHSMCEKVKSGLAESDPSDIRLLTGNRIEAIHHSPEKEDCTDTPVTFGAIDCTPDSAMSMNNNDKIQTLSTESHSNNQNITSLSPPCDLLPGEQMEVTDQLGSLHFKNHSLAECNGSAIVNGHASVTSCSHVCDKMDAESVQEVEESTSEDSSSDSETDSDSSSSTSSSSLASALQVEEEEVQGNGDAPLKTKDEVLLIELPAVDELSISLPEDVDLRPFGSVSSIIEQLVIIESLRDIPPLNEESVVFNENRLAVGKIFEIFGPVPHPYYVIRFNAKEHIEASGIKIKDTMYFAPSVEDFTQYLIPNALKRERGSDASWTNDQEPPPEVLDYSDDEKEREAKQKKKAQTGKNKQKAERNKTSTNTQDASQFRGGQKFSRHHSRNSSASHFSHGWSSHQQQNSYPQPQRPYFTTGFQELSKTQHYAYHNTHSQEYTMPSPNIGHPPPSTHFYGPYGNIPEFPAHFPPPPLSPGMNWPDQNLYYHYMQNSHFFLPPPPPPLLPPPPDSSFSSGDAGHSVEDHS